MHDTERNGGSATSANGHAAGELSDWDLAIAWAKVLVAPNQVVELRALHVATRYGRPYTRSGFYDYDHLSLMTKDAREWHEAARGTYFTINHLEPSLLARRANRWDRAEEGEVAADRNVIRRR